MKNARTVALSKPLLVVTGIVPVVIYFFVYQVFATVFLLVRLPVPWNAVLLIAYWPAMLLGTAALSFMKAIVLSRHAASLALHEASDLTLYKSRSETSEQSAAYPRSPGITSSLCSVEAGSATSTGTAPEVFYDPVAGMESRARQLRIVAGVYALAAGLVPIYYLVRFHSEV
ncbi:MAG: hypothetical protein ACOH14_11440 [Rhodoglobus sp.]